MWQLDDIAAFEFTAAAELDSQYDHIYHTPLSMPVLVQTRLATQLPARPASSRMWRLQVMSRGHGCDRLLRLSQTLGQDCMGMAQSWFR